MSTTVQIRTHEESALLSRRKKLASISRPFPPGFTPVTQLSLSVSPPSKQNNNVPIFLPPTLRSPLPPVPQNSKKDELQVEQNRASKHAPTPILCRNQSPKLIPSIRKICSNVRLGPRQSSPLSSDPHSLSSTESHPNHLTEPSRPSPIVKPRLRSVSQHPSKTPIPIPRTPAKPSHSSGKTHENTHLSASKQRLSAQLIQKTKSLGDLRSLRQRSLSTCGSNYSLESIRSSSLVHISQAQPGQHSKHSYIAPPTFSISTKRVSREPLTPHYTQQMQYASRLWSPSDSIEHVASPTPSINRGLKPIHIHSEPREMKSKTTKKAFTVQKLPDSVLDDWAEWKHEVLFQLFSPTSEVNCATGGPALPPLL